MFLDKRGVAHVLPEFEACIRGPRDSLYPCISLVLEVAGEEIVGHQERVRCRSAGFGWDFQPCDFWGAFGPAERAQQ